MFPDLLRKRFPDLEAGKIALLEAHWELLRFWNKKLNLTTISDLDAAVERHYAESLFLGLRLPLGPLQVVDIGAGAGFPGFPVAVLRPECKVTLIESHQRKAVFLREASRKLPNVWVVAKRAEEVAAGFDVAISRAVSYHDLEGSLRRLASRAMLLTGHEVPPDGLGFVWEPGIPLPLGNRRFLRIGMANPPANRLP
ncbi:MAG TPA: 16S rRNA (guanine(527)-N(7))-methyltransferase RsmG [Candidatus Acidoferrales bacterium]|nr:16S rRNA (guanine(527)-N(7))-methyltransferase RsmG [Candidatus Acidoferrales bacterium]